MYSIYFKNKNFNILTLITLFYSYILHFATWNGTLLFIALDFIEEHRWTPLSNIYLHELYEIL